MEHSEFDQKKISSVITKLVCTLGLLVHYEEVACLAKLIDPNLFSKEQNAIIKDKLFDVVFSFSTVDFKTRESALTTLIDKYDFSLNELNCLMDSSAGQDLENEVDYPHSLPMQAVSKKSATSTDAKAVNSFLNERRLVRLPLYTGSNFKETRQEYCVVDELKTLGVFIDPRVEKIDGEWRNNIHKNDEHRLGSAAMYLPKGWSLKEAFSQDPSVHIYTILDNNNDIKVELREQY